MSRFVFVLGAGASADGGAPTADNFMDKAERFLTGSSALGGRDRDAFELVFKASSKLRAVHSKAILDLDNLEVLFNAFEMAALFNRLGDLSTDEVRGLPDAMRRVIARTIEKAQVFPVEYEESRLDGRKLPSLKPPHSYRNFATLLKKFIDNSSGRVSVLTFNYDLALDLALLQAEIPFDYSLDEAIVGKLDVLKLHGSLNWRRCGCDKIAAWQFDEFFGNNFLNQLLGKRQYSLEGSLYQPKRQHCEKQYDLEPVIVPPTWNKGLHHAQLSNVWRRAARHFSDAEYVFIAGYSYPPSDEFFRYLYALGSVGESRLKQIFVFNPDTQVADRIRGLLGPLAQNKFKSEPLTFIRAIQHLHEWHNTL